MKYQTINLSKIDGGINTAAPPTQIEDNQLVNALNMEWDDEGNLTSRKGVTKIGSASPALTVKGTINNIKIDQPRRLAYDETKGFLFVCDWGTTRAVYIVDVNDPENPKFLGKCESASYCHQPTDVAVKGDYLLITDPWNDMVSVWDISDPINPSYVRNHTDATYLDSCGQIFVNGDYAYVANSNAGTNGAMVVLDVSNLASGISEASKLTAHTGGKYAAIVPEKNRIYQTNESTHELHIIDITTPTAISLVISYLDAVNMNLPQSVAADAAVVIVSNAATDTLTVVDATNETTLTLLSTITDAVRLNNVDDYIYKRGNIILCPSYWSDTLAIVNVADPSNPTIIADISIPGRFDQLRDAVIVDDYVFCVSHGDDYLLCLNLEVPKPFQTIESDTTSITGQMTKYRVTPNERWMCVLDTTGDDIHILDRNDESDIKVVDSETNLTAYFPSHSYDYPVDVAWNDALDRLYLISGLNGGGQAGVSIFSFNSTTGKIAHISSSPFSDGGGQGGGGYFTDDAGDPYVAFQNSAGSSQNLLVIKVKDDTATQVGSYNWSGATATRSELNRTARVMYSTYGSGIGVFDLSDPTNPVLQTTIATTYNVSPILTADLQTLWTFKAGATGSNIAEWDTSDPYDPTFVQQSFFPLARSIGGEPYYDPTTEKIYMTSATDDALIVVNVASYPWIQEYLYVDSTNIPQPYGVHVKGDYAMVLDNGRITMVKAVVEASYEIVWEISNVPLDEVYAVKIYGQRLAAVSKTSDALSIINISNPAAPVQLGSLTDATKLNGTIDCAWFGDGQYVACIAPGYSGVTIYDVSDPLNISETGTLTTSVLASCTAIVIDSSDEFAYISTNGSLCVVDLRNPAAPTLVSALPDATKYANMDGLAFLNDNYLCGIAPNYVLVWDIQLPFAPYLAGSLNDTSQTVGRCDSDGTYLYASCATAGTCIRIYDLSTPTAPTLHSTATGAGGSYGLRLVAIDKTVWTTSASNNKIGVFDVSDPSTPTNIANLTDANNLPSTKLLDSKGFDCYTPSSTKDRITVVRLGGLGFRSDVSSIYQLLNETGTDEVIVTEGRNILHLQADETYEPVHGSMDHPTDAKWEWCTFDGLMFGVNGGDMGTYDNMVYWDGQTAAFAPVTDFPGATGIAPSSICVWNSRVFVAAGNTIYWSKIGDGTDYSHLTSGSVEVNPNDGDEIVKIVPHKGVLVIFKKNKIFRLLTGVPNTSTSKWSVETVAESLGCSSAVSVQPVMNDIAFMSKAGLMSLVAADQIGDFAPASLSFKVGSLRDLPEGDYPAIRVEGNEQYWITTDEDGDGTLDTIWALDYQNINDGGARWTKFDGLVVGTAYGIVRENGYNRVYIGGDGFLYKLKRTGDTNLYRDDTVSITNTILSKEFDMGITLGRKEIERWGASIEKVTTALTVTVKIYFDHSTTAAHTFSLNAGALANGDFEVWRKVLGAAGRRFTHMQIEFSNDTVDESFALNSIALRVGALSTRHASDL